ncbi:MAG: DinB family protein [Ilumatobacter sp.]|nr:DinB family protein [Ilumatobacter sp.]MCB0984970.1 DinB family protein [Ilumatobacter sp.]
MDLHGWMTADLASLRTKLYDGVMGIVPADRWHEQADGGGSTIAGLLLHLARHQDLAVNAVIRNHDPLFAAHRSALGLADAPAAVCLAEREAREWTGLADPAAVTAYVTDVFDTTTAWLDRLGSLATDIEPNTAYRLTHRGGLDPDELPWLYSMWGGKALWWFVQWPVLGHGHTHTGEAVSIRNRFGLSPF